jgi:hypothetical protein
MKTPKLFFLLNPPTAVQISEQNIILRRGFFQILKYQTAVFIFTGLAPEA